MTHKPILDYLENINTNLKDFSEKSFFRMDLSEIQGSFRKGINFPAMTVESPEGNTAGSSINSTVMGRTAAFTVYMNPTRGNFAQQNEYLDLCERIGLKILARMRLDNSDPNNAMFNKFVIPSISWIKVGPIFTENLFGYRFTIDIKGAEGLKVNAADWEDLDLVC